MALVSETARERGLDQRRAAPYQGARPIEPAHEEISIGARPQAEAEMPCQDIAREPCRRFQLRRVDACPEAGIEEVARLLHGRPVPRPEPLPHFRGIGRGEGICEAEDDLVAMEILQRDGEILQGRMDGGQKLRMARHGFADEGEPGSLTQSRADGTGIEIEDAVAEAGAGSSMAV